MPGVVGMSAEDLPRVGVRGGTSSGSDAAARACGGGAASDGRIGVDVWRSTCGGRGREEVLEAQGLVRMSGRFGGESEVSLMAGVEGREASSSSW